MNFVPILLLAATAAASPVSPPVKQGVDYWQAGDYDRATRSWMPSAQAGDADAQFNLAQAYKLGRGVPMDMRQAETWYRKAAEQNHAQAGAMLGLIMFQNGDRKGALPWIQRAAERGDPRAQYVYGTALFNGDEVTKDWPRAYALMTRAAAAGLPQAATSLGQMDQFIPLSDREAGMRLARGGARVAGAELASRDAPAPAISAARPSPAIRATDLPPSRVSASPPPPAARTGAPLPRPARPAIMAATPALKPIPPRPVPVAVAAAPVAKPAASSAGGWRIQLGAYSNPVAAKAQWNRLAARDGLRSLRPFMVKAGAVTRLQAGPFASRTAAAQACRAAAAAGAQCFPVAG